jgi:hypothetical protein
MKTMGMLLKCAGVWLFILWYKEDAFVLCNNDDLQKYSPTGNHSDPKPLSRDMMDAFSRQNDADPLHKESDQLNSKSVFFSERAVATTEYISTVSNEDGSTANLGHAISRVDTFSNIPAKELSGRSGFLIVEQDNETRSRRGEREEVSADTSLERVSSSMEMADKNTEKYSGVFDERLKLDMNNQSAGNCSECSGTVRNGKNARDSAVDESGTVGQVKGLPTDSAANLTVQDTTVHSGISTPVTQVEHNFGSLHNTVALVTLSSWNKALFKLDVAVVSAEKPNATSRSPDFKISTRKVKFLASLSVFLYIVTVVFFCYTFCRFWERKLYYRGYSRMPELPA